MVDLMDSFLLDETDCSGKFLRYFARLYISLCLYVIEHSIVFRKPKLLFYLAQLGLYTLLKILQTLSALLRGFDNESRFYLNVQLRYSISWIYERLTTKLGGISIEGLKVARRCADISFLIACICAEDLCGSFHFHLRWETLCLIKSEVD